LLVRPNQTLRSMYWKFLTVPLLLPARYNCWLRGSFHCVLSALLSLELERQRELGILRAVGLTVRQLWSLILLETV